MTTDISSYFNDKGKSKKGIESYNCVLKNDFEGLQKTLLEDSISGVTFKDDRGGDTALHKAAFFGFDECVHILLKNGANINELNDNKSTPLIKASFAGKHKCIEILLKAGADVNQVNDANDTALLGAAWIGNDECVSLLLNYGAKIDVVDSLGQDYKQIQNKKKDEFKSAVKKKSKAYGLSDVLYSMYENIKIDDMENHYKSLVSNGLKYNHRHVTPQQLLEGINIWKDNYYFVK